jgi:mRNA interferase HicA
MPAQRYAAEPLISSAMAAARPIRFVKHFRLISGRGGAMKQSEFVRWLTQHGATFRAGSGHVKVYLNGKQSHLPRHPAKELKTGLVEGVKKQLGLK